MEKLTKNQKKAAKHAQKAADITKSARAINDQGLFMTGGAIKKEMDKSRKILSKDTKERVLRDRATKGSPPFNDSEIEKGFRCIK